MTEAISPFLRSSIAAHLLGKACGKACGKAWNLAPARRYRPRFKVHRSNACSHPQDGGMWIDGRGISAPAGSLDSGTTGLGQAEAFTASPSAACPAAKRAVSTRNGEHDT